MGKVNCTNIYRVILLMALVCMGTAQTVRAQDITGSNSKISVQAKSSDSVPKKEQIDNSQILDAQKEIVDERIKNLESTIFGQKELIEKLEWKLDSLNKKPETGEMNFSIWSSILLGSVAVIVTVLGVGIAILSFIGYRELIQKGTESAKLIAAERTKLEFDQFIADGKLDAVIAEGINRIVYRGIASGQNDDDGDNAPNN